MGEPGQGNSMDARPAWLRPGYDFIMECCPRLISHNIDAYDKPFACGRGNRCACFAVNCLFFVLIVLGCFCFNDYSRFSTDNEKLANAIDATCQIYTQNYTAVNDCTAWGGNLRTTLKCNVELSVEASGRFEWGTQTTGSNLVLNINVDTGGTPDCTCQKNVPKLGPSFSCNYVPMRYTISAIDPADGVHAGLASENQQDAGTPLAIGIVLILMAAILGSGCGYCWYQSCMDPGVRENPCKPMDHGSGFSTPQVPMNSSPDVPPKELEEVAVVDDNRQTLNDSAKWKQAENKDGKVYWYNTETRETTWQNPNASPPGPPELETTQ